MARLGRSFPNQPIIQGGLVSTSHDATGALAASPAVVAGSAAHLTLHPSSGALTAQAATVAGSANHVTVHASSGALVAQDATVSGSATHTATGSFAASGALAADAATVAGTATHLTLHTATGALVADAASISGTVAHTGDGAVFTAPNQGAGRSRKRRQEPERYVIAIDGKDVIVSSVEEAESLLDGVKAAAQEKADLALKRANGRQRQTVGKVVRDARRAMDVPQIEAPPELADYAQKVIEDIRARYQEQLQAIEITALLRKREQQQEEDDEDVLMLIA